MTEYEKPSMTCTKIGICIPTSRMGAVSSFAKRWEEVLHHSVKQNISFSVYIHEDAPLRTSHVCFPSASKVLHTCQQDLEEMLGENHWIIPRKSGACRSFPMYLAWKDRCDFILTLDDDCYPLDDNSNSFFTQHLDAFKTDRWFRTISGLKPRGVPYTDRGTLPVILNHGVWLGEPDLDGPTSLTTSEASSKVVLRANREVIPPGMYFPLCAMNVCYHRSALPAAYNLLMGMDLCGFDRFDDIWSGLFLKCIADYLGLYITNGLPFVYHAKASNPFVNNQKEAFGIRIHEFFWRHIAKTQLSASNISGCYAELAEQVKCFPKEFPEAPVDDDYFERLGTAMHTWLTLFNE